MKRCPHCLRTYSDETLSFCPADGQLLSAPYDVAATTPLAPRATNEAATRIFAIGPTPERARTLIRRSWIVGAVGIPFGAIIVLIQISTMPQYEDPTSASLVAAAVLSGLIYGYLFWSAWWGFPVVWRWWRDFARMIFRFVTDRVEFKGGVLVLTIIAGLCLVGPALALVLLYFYSMFWVGFAYSFFGGGIYQFLRHRKIARQLPQPA